MTQDTNSKTQPTGAITAFCQSGVLGWLWSLLGSSTPAYAGTGQPVAGRGWCGWLGATPTYQVAPAASVSPQETTAVRWTKRLTDD